MTPAKMLDEILDVLAEKVADKLRPAQPKEDLLVSEVAALVRRAPYTVRMWIADGYLPARRERGRLLVRRADLEAHQAGLPTGSKAPRRGSKAAARRGLVSVAGGAR